MNVGAEVMGYKGICRFLVYVSDGCVFLGVVEGGGSPENVAQLLGTCMASWHAQVWVLFLAS